MDRLVFLIIALNIAATLKGTFLITCIRKFSYEALIGWIICLCTTTYLAFFIIEHAKGLIG